VAKIAVDHSYLELYVAVRIGENYLRSRI